MSIFNAKEYFYIQRTWTNYKVIYKVIINKYDENLNPKFLNYDFFIIYFIQIILKIIYMIIIQFGNIIIFLKKLKN